MLLSRSSSPRKRDEFHPAVDMLCITDGAKVMASRRWNSQRCEANAMPYSAPNKKRNALRTDAVFPAPDPDAMAFMSTLPNSNVGLHRNRLE